MDVMVRRGAEAEAPKHRVESRHREKKITPSDRDTEACR